MKMHFDPLLKKQVLHKHDLEDVSPVNNIGVPGTMGFGVGICPPELLSRYNAANPGGELIPMYGTFDPQSDNYGNYTCALDGSVMVWLPFGWVKRNPWSVVPEDYFTSEAAANAAGYMLPRCMINGGVVQRGVMVDKYNASLTGITAADLDASGSLPNKGILSSIKFSAPISCHDDSLRKLVNEADNLFAGSFSNCRRNGKSPSNTLAGGIDAVKTRGNDYFVMSVFIRSYIFDLVMAHQAASQGNTTCGWNSVSPFFPKGNNNYGADTNDTSVVFLPCTDAFWGNKPSTMEARKNGGGTPFARTTHNGQSSGISDINGNLYDLLIGLTCIAESSQSIVSISRAVEAVVTVTNAQAARSNYQNAASVMILGTAATEWNTLLKDKLFTISDLNGNTFKIKDKTGNYVNTSDLSADYTSGLTSTTGKFYLLKESVDLKNITSGNTLSTDHWGSTGVAAMYDEIILDLAGDINSRLGNSTNIVYSSSPIRSGNDYKLGAALLPVSKNSYNSTGTDAYGKDYFYAYICNDMAPLAFMYWYNGTHAGVGASYLYSGRSSTSRAFSARACLYM